MIYSLLIYKWKEKIRFLAKFIEWSSFHAWVRILYTMLGMCNRMLQEVPT